MNIEGTPEKDSGKNSRRGRVTADAEYFFYAVAAKRSIETETQSQKFNQLENTANIPFVYNACRGKEDRIAKTVVPFEPAPVLPAGRADIKGFDTLSVELFLDEISDFEMSPGPTSGNSDQSFAFLLTINTIPIATERAIMELPP